MPTVAGVDSSTQSCKIVVCDADTGQILHRGRAPHPDGTEVSPEAWWRALLAAGDGLLDQVDAIAVAGQQHGLVTAVDDTGQPVRDALLWNDTRSAQAAADLVAELGMSGPSTPTCSPAAETARQHPRRVQPRLRRQPRPGRHRHHPREFRRRGGPPLRHEQPQLPHRARATIS